MTSLSDGNFIWLRLRWSFWISYNEASPTLRTRFDNTKRANCIHMSCAGKAREDSLGIAVSSRCSTKRRFFRRTSCSSNRKLKRNALFSYSYARYCNDSESLLTKSPVDALSPPPSTSKTTPEEQAGGPGGRTLC